MLYAAIPKDHWGGLGMEWDKTQSMFSYLNSMRGYMTDAYYQLIFESSMFGVPPNYRCVLVRWSEIRNPPIGRRREALIESSDPKQVEAVLLMLISIAEEEKRARGG